ncbi:16388_t:CDS:1, partial [Acaulospora morrowiae]
RRVRRNNSIRNSDLACQVQEVSAAITSELIHELIHGIKLDSKPPSPPNEHEYWVNGSASIF